MLVTLATMRTQVRELGNYENSARFTDSFVNTQIGKAWSELYELLSNTHQGYYDKDGPLTTVAGQNYVDLPSDFWRLRGVDVLFANEYLEMSQIGIQERNRYQLSAQPRAYRVAAGAVVGNTRGRLLLYPTPDQVYTLRIVYEPTRPDLVNDTDAIEDWNGWVDYVVTAALLRLDEREQRPLNDRIAMLERIKDRIVKGASERRAGEPEYLTLPSHRHGLWGGW